jgi:putative salt-induced outer membrane protein YdiY
VALPGEAEARQQPTEAEWRNAAEVTYLLNGGNAASSTLGFRNSLRRRSPTDEWRLVLTARRTDATRIERRAVGASPDDFVVEEERDRERTAERYAAETRYDRTLRENVFAFGSLGWERNELAGLDHRLVAVTGAGVQWQVPEAWQVKVGYGLTYTLRRDVVRDPGRDDSFAGLRLTLDYLHALTDGTELEVSWVADANAQEWSETRGDLTQAVSAALTDRLSLKTTLQVLVENEPPLEVLRLVAPDGTDTEQEVRVPLRRVDHSLSVAVVITL